MKRIAVLLTGLLLAVLFSGCTKTDTDAAVTVGTNTWPGYESLYLAETKGFYPESVKLKRMGSASEVLQAFRNGKIDMAALTLDEVLILKDQGYSPKIVLIMDFSNGGDVIVAKEGIKTMQELKGKRVGFENTALGAYVLERALELNGMHFSDIIALPAAYSDHLNFYQNDIVDAVVTFEPVRTQLLNAGAHQIFDSSMIPGEIVDVLIVRERFLKEHQPLVKTVIDGWKKAYAYTKQNPADAASVMAHNQKITEAEFTASLEGLELPDMEKNLAYLNGTAPKLLGTLENLHRVMKEKHLLSTTGNLNLNDLFCIRQSELMEMP